MATFLIRQKFKNGPSRHGPMFATLPKHKEVWTHDVWPRSCCAVLNNHGYVGDAAVACAVCTRPGVQCCCYGAAALLLQCLWCQQTEVCASLWVGEPAHHEWLHSQCRDPAPHSTQHSPTAPQAAGACEPPSPPATCAPPHSPSLPCCLPLQEKLAYASQEDTEMFYHGGKTYDGLTVQKAYNPSEDPKKKKYSLDDFRATVGIVGGTCSAIIAVEVVALLHMHGTAAGRPRGHCGCDGWRGQLAVLLCAPAIRGW
jgi:hypothetical protein